MSENFYEYIGDFRCADKDMVVIKTGHGTHVMEVKDWESIKRTIVGSNKNFHIKKRIINVA